MGCFKAYFLMLSYLAAKGMSSQFADCYDIYKYVILACTSVFPSHLASSLWSIPNHQALLAYPEASRWILVLGNGFRLVFHVVTRPPWRHKVTIPCLHRICQDLTE